METWSTHQLYQQAVRTHGSETAESLRHYAQHLISQRLPVIFTLGHLSKITGVHYKVLRATVNRKRESSNYRMYAVKKRAGGRRFIHSVSKDLFTVQRFINQEILQNCDPHPASFAFHRSGGIRECASIHCGAKWLFQVDLTDFFYDITEIDVYRVFQALGYRNLLSFELARLCTTIHLPQWQKRLLFHEAIPTEATSNNMQNRPYPEGVGAVGVLPQGAPTSPMLSNLAARKLDEFLSSFALEHGFMYTRYADDITFSASTLSNQMSIGKIHKIIVSLIRRAGFKENEKKTRVSGPGSKKVVLGLLIDGEEPRITKETYHRIDRHIYAVLKYGLANTAFHEGFDSAYGFYNHLTGLIAFVKDVDHRRWIDFHSRFIKVPTPWRDV